jgi:hypothetical protein
MQARTPAVPEERALNIKVATKGYRKDFCAAVDLAKLARRIGEVEN